MYGVAVPFWVTAGRRVRKVVKNRYVPLLALGAAYCFLVMMFNVPIPDGTTAHAVGAVLVAVLLGPWAAVIAVSIALLIQALFFGDGGVLAYGANGVNMAVVMPFVGYGVYRVLARRTSLTSPKRALAAGVGAYVGHQRGRAVRRDRVRPAARPLLQDERQRGQHPALRAVPPVPDDPGDAARPPRRGRRRRARPDRRGRRLPAAGQPAGAAHQPPSGPGDRRRPAAAAEAQPEVGVRRSGRDGGARPPRPASPAAPPSGRTAPSDSTWRSTTSAPCRPGWRGTATPGATRSSPATTSRAASHPTFGYYVSAGRRAPLIIGVAVIGLFALGAGSCAGGRPRARRASNGRRDMTTSVTAATGRPPTGWCSSGRAVPVRLHRQAQEGQLRRPRRSTAPRRCCARPCSPRTSPTQPGLLQRLDPRVKLLSLARPAGRHRLRPRRVVVLAGHLRGHAGARRGQRDSRSPFFVKRVWLFIPIFTGIVVLPGHA